jgi:hypothetical protein
MKNKAGLQAVTAEKYRKIIKTLIILFFLNCFVLGACRKKVSVPDEHLLRELIEELRALRDEIKAARSEFKKDDKGGENSKSGGNEKGD